MRRRTFLLMVSGLLSVFAVVAEAPGAEFKLVMLGDSITLSARNPEGGKMPQLTEKALNEVSAGRVAWTVVNAGVGSETADGGLKRVAAILTREKPQVITIDYGANDMGRKDPKWFEDRLRALIDAVQNHPSRPQVVLLTGTPSVDARHFYGRDPFFADAGGPDAYLDRKINAATRRLAAERKLPLIDVHRAFVAAPVWQKLMTSDGVHPTVEGNRVIAACVARGLAAFVEARSSPKSKAAEAEKSVRAKLDQAKKAVAAGNRADARRLVDEAAGLCPYLAEVWVAADELDAPDRSPGAGK